jgi:GNAT superfamily N-acetyltransferase
MDLVDRAWRDYAELSQRFYSAARRDGALNGDRWFTALSFQDSTELNVAGLLPGADVDDARELLDRLGPSLPVLVFTSQWATAAARDVFASAGFAIATVNEPLMWCAVLPRPVDGSFRCIRAEQDELPTAVAVTSEAHLVPEAMIVDSFGRAALDGAAHVWLAWDDAIAPPDAVSSVWLLPGDNVIGVAEMMTPARHQRRGAGQQLLTAALNVHRPNAPDGAVLLSTPAGRRLYESIGFRAVDEVVTCYRGLTDDLLAAIGQPT